MFTAVAIEGQFTNADGSPAIGTVCVTPHSTMENDGAVVLPTPIIGALDSEGRIVASDGSALIVNATDDLATTPIGSYYVFSLKISGEGLVEFASGIPSGNNEQFPVGVIDYDAATEDESAIVTLGTLIAADTMIGAIVTTSKFAGSPTVLSVNAIANTVTLSENATASGIDDDFRIASGAVSFEALQENAL